MCSRTSLGRSLNQALASACGKSLGSWSKNRISIPRMAVTGATSVLATFVGSRAGFSLSLASCDFTKTMRRGHMFAEVGPILARS